MNRLLVMVGVTGTAACLAGCDAMIDQFAQDRVIETAKEQVATMLGGGKPRFRAVFQSPANFTCGEVARYQSTKFQRFFASGIDEPFLEEDLGKEKIDMMWNVACIEQPDGKLNK